MIKKLIVLNGSYGNVEFVVGKKCFVSDEKVVESISRTATNAYLVQFVGGGYAEIVSDNVIMIG
jgi:hypothetical protein